MNRSTIAAAAVLAAFGSASAASRVEAYGWLECRGKPIIWSAARANMFINTVSMPPHSIDDKLVQNAMWHWNNVAGSRFTFFVGRDKDGKYRTGNGVNEIVYGKVDEEDTLAFTDVLHRCASLVETDIIFDQNADWSVSEFNYLKLGSPYSLEGTALHELGHVVGLEHEDRVLETMNTLHPSGGPVGQNVEWDPLPDAREGVRFLYPENTSESDVSGTVLKTNNAGSAVRVTQTKTVLPGNQVTMQLTILNHSTARKTFNIQFYLSPNDVVSTKDRLLGTNTGAFLDPGVVLTFTRSLTIPADVAPGTYWLGFWVDSGRNISEWKEDDNWSVHPQKLTVELPG
jgi:hypothetical protein